MHQSSEPTIILDPTEEVFGKCLDGIARGLITVLSAGDFPVGEKCPAGTVDKIVAAHLKYGDGACGRSLPYARTTPDKNHKPRHVGDHPALRRIWNI